MDQVIDVFQITVYFTSTKKPSATCTMQMQEITFAQEFSEKFIGDSKQF